MNDTAVSRRHSNSSLRRRRPEHENKGKTQFSMTTENRRKEETEAKTEDSKRNFVPPLNSAMVDEEKGKNLSYLIKYVPGHSDC